MIKLGGSSKMTQKQKRRLTNDMLMTNRLSCGKIITLQMSWLPERNVP